MLRMWFSEWNMTVTESNHLKIISEIIEVRRDIDRVVVIEMTFKTLKTPMKRSLIRESHNRINHSDCLPLYCKWDTTAKRTKTHRYGLHRKWATNQLICWSADHYCLIYSIIRSICRKIFIWFNSGVYLHNILSNSEITVWLMVLITLCATEADDPSVR